MASSVDDGGINPTSPAEQKANAKFLRAQARKAEAEARTAESIATKAELESAKAVEADAARRAADEFHYVYRFEGSVTESSVNTAIVKLTEWHRLDPTCTIEIIFSSPGGGIFEGMKLYDFINDLSGAGHHTITGGVGMAASMAGILLQAGKTRYLTTEAWLLIHRAAFGAMGQTFEVEDRVKLIQRIEKRIINIFVSKSDGKLTTTKIKRNWDRKDWWISSDEALTLGLIDEVRGIQGLGDDG